MQVPNGRYRSYGLASRARKGRVAKVLLIGKYLRTAGGRNNTRMSDHALVHDSMIQAGVGILPVSEVRYALNTVNRKVYLGRLRMEDPNYK